jgi:macrolide transport system ATP-binding/permease protein
VDAGLFIPERLLANSDSGWGAGKLFGFLFVGVAAGTCWQVKCFHRRWEFCLMAMRDLRFALRQFTKSPGFAVAVVLTLALGIGVNTAVFSMVDAFMLRALPYRQPEKVAALIFHSQGTSAARGQSFADDDDSHDGETWQAAKEGLRSVELAAWGATGGVNLQAGSAVRYVHDTHVSADYFEVLGVGLALGRTFTAEEDRPKGPNAVVLSYGLWQSAFHGDPSLIGRAIYLKGDPFTVVGVLKRGAVTPAHADLFTPLMPATTGECGGTNCGILMRLKPGANWQQLAAELSQLRTRRFERTLKNAHGSAWFYAQPLARYTGGDMQPKIKVLMVAVGFILAIACANLAGLALVRIARRSREIATRLALGATRIEVLRQLWIENLLLALLGGAAGLGLGLTILKGLERLLPDEMLPVAGFSMDARVLGFTFLASLLASVLFGMLPAMTTRKVDLRSAMSAGSYSVAGGSGGIRQWLISAEIALTVVLLAAAGLLVRTLIQLETLPPGFDAHNVMTAKASLDDAHYHDAGAFRDLLTKSVAAMRAIPGVQAAAVALSVPYERGLNDGITILDGKQAGERTGSSMSYVTSGYTSVLGIPLLAGRGLAENETSTSQPVALVNEDFAQKFFNDRSPIGRHFRLDDSGDPVYTIVGVIANVAKRPGMEGDAPLGAEPVFYVPATQIPQGLVNVAHLWFQPSWIVRTAGPISGLTESMQKALASVDPLLPFSGFYSMDQILAQQLRQQRIEVLLFGSLAGLALALSAIGIYALVSNLVVQRTREIGIRIALGSTLGRAMRQVGSAGLMAAGIGLCVGIGLSLFAVRVLASEIYGVGTYDPVTFVIVPLLLAGIAGVASFLPTLRIGRIEPAETLRSE